MTEELPDYRPVSRLAVAALVVGMASCLVLFTPLAAMLPLIAIALASVALKEIRKSEGRMVGRWPALGGLALSVGFASQTLSMSIVEGILAKQRATATAVSWVTALREGRPDDAIAVSSPGALMAIAHDGHDVAIDPKTRTAAFQALPEVSAAAGCGKTSPRPTETERLQDGWVVRFSLDPCGLSGGLTLAVAPRLTVVRGRVVEEWRVSSFTLEP